MEKKSSSRHFLGHSGGGQETTFYLRVASGLPWVDYKFETELTEWVLPWLPEG